MDRNDGADTPAAAAAMPATPAAPAAPAATPGMTTPPSGPTDPPIFSPNGLNPGGGPVRHHIGSPGATGHEQNPVASEGSASDNAHSITATPCLPTGVGWAIGVA